MYYNDSGKLVIVFDKQEFKNMEEEGVCDPGGLADEMEELLDMIFSNVDAIRNVACETNEQRQALAKLIELKDSFMDGFYSDDEIVMPTGSYKGEYIIDLPSGYLKWVSENWDEENIKRIAKEEYERRDEEHDHF